MSILSNNFYYQPLKIDSINTKVYGDFVAKEPNCLVSENHF